MKIPSASCLCFAGSFVFCVAGIGDKKGKRAMEKESKSVGQAQKVAEPSWLRQLGDSYEMVDFLKETGESKVFLLYDRRAKRVCVAKERSMHSHELYREIKKLGNPYVPQIFYLLEQDDRLIVIEEFIDGSTLASCLEYAPLGKLEEKTVRMMLCQLCACLETFHQQGIIHRDIKPSNIMVMQQGQVKLIDFGIARLMKSGDVTETDTEILGTKGYAAPEQYGFGQTDARSDIYALGITMQQALGKGYQGSLSKILVRCTELDPARRYPSVSALRRDLQRNNVLYRVRQWGILFLIAALGGVFWWGSHFSPSEQEQDAPQVSETGMISADSEIEPAEPGMSPEPVAASEKNVEESISESEVITAPPSPAKKSSLVSQVYLSQSDWNREAVIDEATWRTWQWPDGSVHLPSNWNVQVHIDNPTARNYPSSHWRVKILRADATPVVIEDVREDGSLMAGQTGDFVLDLSQYPLMDSNTIEVSFFLDGEDGKSKPVLYHLQTKVTLAKQENFAGLKQAQEP